MSSKDRDQVLRGAVEDLLLPLARLCVARGLPFAQVEELFKHAYVRAARETRQAQGVAAQRDGSQVSVATGISRREVARITAALQPRAAQRPSAATQLFTLWLSDPALRDRRGRPRKLPRQGEAPSFEALATSVTRHVHPRSLLDELIRLGLVRLGADGETVELLHQRFVPDRDEARLLGFLAANVGDHLAAAAANVVHGDRRHFEQAVFGHKVSAETAAQVRELAQAQWLRLTADVVPALQRALDDDHAAGRARDHRVRIGLFSYSEPLAESDDEATS